VIVHWDDVEAERAEEGHLAGTWFDLGTAAGSRNVGVTRIKVDPGRWSTPAHVELDEEEIYYVLGGSGLLWQGGKTYEVGAGDCVVERVAEEPHTFRAGDDGLDVLAFGERTNPTATHLPRARVVRMAVTVDVSQGPHPWEREAAAGEPDLPSSPSPRPPNVSGPEAVQTEEGGSYADLADLAGSVRSGLNWIRLDPGRRGSPPHCHSAEEELFVILAGEGVLELWPTPGSPRLHPDFEYQEHALRAGHVVSRPAGTRIAHSLRANEAGLTYLAYGTRDTNDVCYYPRSNKIFWRGVGLIARLEPLEYEDGEPED
jgi:uncharacterized cupin superfamily protein